MKELRKEERVETRWIEGREIKGIWKGVPGETAGTEDEDEGLWKEEGRAEEKEKRREGTD